MSMCRHDASRAPGRRPPRRPLTELLSLLPCSLLTFCNYVLFGLSIGTVSLIAERLKVQDREGAAHALSTSLFLGAVGGAPLRRAASRMPGGMHVCCCCCQRMRRTGWLAGWQAGL